MKHKAIYLAGLLAIAFSSFAISQGDVLHKGKVEEEAVARRLTPKEKLGRLVFNDINLSEPAGQSCASCHDANFAATDPDQWTPTSQGIHPELFGNRNTPTAMYMAFSPAFQYDEEDGVYVGGQFFDGRASSLEEQAKGPFLNPVEMANSSKGQVVDKVRAAEYAGLFKRVFGKAALDDTEAAYDKIAEAIAAFERTSAFNKFTSKYDAWLAGQATLTAQERRGLELFERDDKGNCAACHPNRPAADGTPPLFTDFTYDNLGAPKNPDNAFYKMAKQFNPDGKRFVDSGLGGVLGLASENGKFKVPTLRNIAITGPYMHNGYFRTLRGVVDFYNTRDTKVVCQQEFVAEAAAIAGKCWPKPEVADNVNKDELGSLGLSEREVDDIVAFMGTLTDGWKPAHN